MENETPRPVSRGPQSFQKWMWRLSYICIIKINISHIHPPVTSWKSLLKGGIRERWKSESVSWRWSREAFIISILLPVSCPFTALGKQTNKQKTIWWDRTFSLPGRLEPSPRLCGSGLTEAVGVHLVTSTQVSYREKDLRWTALSTWPATQHRNLAFSKWQMRPRKQNEGSPTIK